MKVHTVVALNEREERFIWAIANGLRPTRAAKVAGYAISSARALLRKPHVAAALRAVHENTRAAVARIEKGEARAAGL